MREVHRIGFTLLSGGDEASGGPYRAKYEILPPIQPVVFTDVI